MDSEHYDIKWKTFPDHLVEVFKELGEDGHFADVTLVSDDQIQTPAHKVVLSACSPVLKNLLVNNPHSHPLLYLRGIKQTELQAILKYMYFGEAQIFENRINNFVSVAKDLEVKKISVSQDEKGKDEDLSKTYQEEEKVNKEPSIPEESEPAVVKREKTRNTERSIAKPWQKSVANSEGRLKCDECAATFSNKPNLRYHIESKHEGVRYPCTDCRYKATTQGALTVHNNSKHAGVRYPCIKCDYKATQKSALTRHIRAQHHEGVQYDCDQCCFKTRFKNALSLHQHKQSEH